MHFISFRKYSKKAHTNNPSLDMVLSNLSSILGCSSYNSDELLDCPCITWLYAEFRVSLNDGHSLSYNVFAGILYSKGWACWLLL